MNPIFAIIYIITLLTISVLIIKKAISYIKDFKSSLAKEIAEQLKDRE